MIEKINFRDFDILGIVKLKDVSGLEKYVTPIIKDGKIEEYLSRSKEYYNVKTMSELSLQREELKSLLTNEYSKRNFVILENMLNCSGKVYFKKLQEYLKNQKSENYLSDVEQAKMCMQEDVNNIIKLLEEKEEITTDKNLMLPAGMENSEKRSIEMDNKAILYLFSKSLNFTKNPEEIEVLNPGYGSIYIGPFLKKMYGYDYTNLFKSKYIDEAMLDQNIGLSNLLSSDRILKEKKYILLLDDNIGTGNTIEEIIEELRENNISKIISGALQYNWRNYYRIATGDKEGIDRFDINNFDIITPINYAGHKLYKQAIDLLHSSGEEYLEYLKAKSYNKDEYGDIDGAIYRGLWYSRKANVNIADKNIDVPYVDIDIPDEILPQYNDGEKKYIKNPIAKNIIDSIIKNIINNDFNHHEL